MSTRGLIGIRFTDTEGKRQFYGCYNHFDSYPSGLGEEVVNFVKKVLQHPIIIEQMKRNVQKIEWVEDSKKPTKKQLHKLTKAGFCAESERLTDIQTNGFDNILIEGASRSTKQRADWYWTLRDYQGIATYEAIFKGIPYLIDYTSFIRSSLFCEYAYVIDLDKEVLEFYKGSQKVYGHINQYIDVCTRPNGSTFLDNEYRESRVEDLGGGHIRHIYDGSRYAYGPCKKVCEKPFDNLDGWKKFYGRDDDD